MRIAHCVEHYRPSIGGMAEVARQVSERIVKAGHHVTVLTSTHPERRATELNGVEVVGFPLSGNAVEGIKGDTAPYINTLMEGRFDIVVFFAAQQWSTDAALPVLERIPGRKIFVPTGFSGLRSPEWKTYYEQMPGWMARMDLTILHSENYQDARFARAHGITSILIPNGAAEEEFADTSSNEIHPGTSPVSDRRSIVHIGSYTGIKGHKEALRIFLKATTGDAVLVFIGNGVDRFQEHFRHHWRFMWLRTLARLRKKQVLFLVVDRNRTIGLLKRATLFLFPSRMECSPIVLFESMAAGVPFLASEAGNASEIARWSGGGWTVPGRIDPSGRMHIDEKAAARKLTEVLADDALLKRTGQHGRAAWKERFTWGRIADQYLEAYLKA